MTLTTKVAIAGTIDIDALFAHCQSIVATPVPFTGKGSGRERTGYHPHTRIVGNLPGIGADALMWVEHGPLFNGCESDTCCPVDVETSAVVRFDTPNSLSSGQARMVKRLAVWCEQRGLSWRWQDEYSGEWFSGSELHRLGKVC